jgi:hypothetical protein
MTEEEYAIVSKKEFMKLKQEIEKLKKNPLQGSPAGENLQESIEGLNTSLTGMMELFKTAADELKIEERDTHIVSQKLDPLIEKVDTLIEQNQKIAKGIVAVADMVREKLEEMEHGPAIPEHKESEMHPLGMPSAPRPEPIKPIQAPTMDMSGSQTMPEPAMPSSMPPMPEMPSPMPPPPKPKKKPILGGFLSK